MTTNDDDLPGDTLTQDSAPRQGWGEDKSAVADPDQAPRAGDRADRVRHFSRVADERFGDVERLDVTVTIIVPSRDRQHRLIDQRQLASRVVRILQELCGRATTVSGLVSTGAMASEYVALVSASMTPEMFRDISSLLVIALYALAQSADQDTVAIKVDETLFLLSNPIA